jgi:hypothetical protein
MNAVAVALALAPLLAHGAAGGSAAGVAGSAAAAVSGAGARAGAANAGTERTEHPGARFAAAVRARLQAGWHVRNVAVEEPTGADAADDERATVELLLASATAAERFVLRFDDAVPTAYQMFAAPLPAEARIFPGEPELVALLAHPVSRLTDECGMPVLHAGEDAVVIDADDSYVVEHTATGAAAATMVADALAGSLLREVEDLSPIDAGALTALRFHLDDGEPRDLRVELGAGGTVLRAELRRVSHQFRDRYYARDAALRKAIRGAGVTRIVDGGKQVGGRFVLILASGARYLVSDGDFAWEPDAAEGEDFECAC